MKTSELPAALQASGASDIGRVRTVNEDAFICDPERGVFAVIDGVGGHAGGEVAAAIARRELDLRLRRETGTIEDRLREAVAAANASILAEAARVPALARMACVLTAAVVTPSRVIAAHVGDTRMYKIGPTGMRKLTRDHSPVGLLEDSGQVSEEEAMRHPERNQVFREVGTTPHQPTDPEFIDIVTDAFGADEAILLCSDGLTDLVPAAAIEATVRREGSDTIRAATELLNAANAAGGKDNVTAVVVARPLFEAAAPSPDIAQRPDQRRPETPPGPRSWPWALAAFAAVFAFVAAAWWWTGGSTPLQTLASMSAAPRVIRVSPQPGADFTSISAALGEARPGDTIEVLPGIYTERIVLREGVMIRSHPRRAAVLGRPSADAAGWTAVTARGIGSGAFSGFVIAGSADAPLDYGVSATDASVEIDDLEITGARVAAIRIAGRSTPVIRSSHLHDNPGAGVVVDGDASPEILHNMIDGHGGAPGHALITVGAAARAVILGNILSSHRGAEVTGLSAQDFAELLEHNALDTSARSPRGRGDQP